MYHPSETGKARRISTKRESVPTFALPILYCTSQHGKNRNIFVVFRM